MTTVLIVGGYGTFGGRLARLLAEDKRVAVVVAGRSRGAADAFCANSAMRGVALDRDGDVEGVLARVAPDVVIDASGPFQVYGDAPYRVATACLALGISYIDLADGSDFVEGIAAFDAAAKARGVFVLSGASTFPALSTAVLRALTRGWRQVERIEMGIAPSPYVDLGRSVIGAIASYAGKPVAIIRDGAAAMGAGLIDARRLTVGAPGMLPLKRRRFTLADVPDLRLAPKLWPGLREIWAGVGTLPAIAHWGLSAAAWLVRLGLLRSLTPLAPLMHLVSTRLRWGAHRGGMVVAARGIDAGGAAIARAWHLVAEGDDGPFVPVMAAVAIVAKVLDGAAPAAGARAALDEVSLEDFAPLFARRAIRTAMHTKMPEGLPLYRRVLAEAWDALPDAIRAMHDGVAAARGLAVVELGRGVLARIAAAVMGFPKAGTDVPVEVTFDAKAGRETWTRRFAGAAFSSVQYAGRGRWDGLLCERFGALSFGLALVTGDGKLRLVVRQWSAFGVKLPAFLAPVGETFERVDAAGRFCFHVEIGFPWTGLIVGYRGWLVPHQNGAGAFAEDGQARDA
ncbi:MAG TPA: DUF4166 domain-containing protein [Rhizomicrobium sp.]|jgi:hypothetical protein|nr:DUF4166 domain-containing protein [Rhizomicrobium sp.]